MCSDATTTQHRKASVELADPLELLVPGTADDYRLTAAGRAATP
ncbi:hypothetical protein [Kitasatospora sp. LaBMicrA B282]